MKAKRRMTAAILRFSDGRRANVPTEIVQPVDANTDPVAIDKVIRQMLETHPSQVAHCVRYLKRMALEPPEGTVGAR
jgi:hypothetical protein